MTPLHIAAREGHQHTLKYIVDNGAVIDIRDYSGVSKTIIPITTAVLNVYVTLTHRHQKKGAVFIIFACLQCN